MSNREYVEELFDEWIALSNRQSGLKNILRTPDYITREMYKFWLDQIIGYAIDFDILHDKTSKYIENKLGISAEGDGEAGVEDA